MTTKKPVYFKYLILALFLSAAFAGAALVANYRHGHKTQDVGYYNEFEKSVLESINPTPTALLENGEEGVRAETGYGRSNIFGKYLIGRFAQYHHDWPKANEVMQDMLEVQPDDIQLLNRGMVLAMGSGDYERSIAYAHKIFDLEKDGGEHSPLSLLFLISEAFHMQDYDQAKIYIDLIPEGSVSQFILPLLQSWSSAAQGKIDIEELMNKSAIHLYHAVLIADFLGKRDEIEPLLVKAEEANDLSIYDLDRLADFYAHIGMEDKALRYYEQILALSPQQHIQDKIDEIKSGNYQGRFQSVENVTQGIANAYYDMARALLDEYSDESARVFGNIALYLDPDYTQAKLLLAHLTTRNERYDEAISYYQSVSEDDHAYIASQREIADLYEELEVYDKAIQILTKLGNTYQDVESFIQLGDLYRIREDYKKALKAYNEAETMLGDDHHEKYWHLYYVRGMAYERDGQWSKAEADLQKALEYQPDHPFVLNYLAYAWADQGIHLDEAQEMLRKAVDIQPFDGFITDSLGWVLFRLGKYDQAIVYLERAIELLPYDPVINDHLGDAYWFAGRKLEAKFQWERAVNYGEVPEEIEAVRAKIERGAPLLDKDKTIKP